MAVGTKTGIYQGGEGFTIPELLWFDFTDTDTMNGAGVGDPLITITDKITALDATQGTAGSRPTIVAGGVDFDGTDDWLSTNIPAVVPPFTIYIKATIDTENPPGGRCVLGNPAPNSSDFVCYYTSAPSIITEFGSTSKSVSTSAQPADFIYAVNGQVTRVNGVESVTNFLGATLGSITKIGNLDRDVLTRFWDGVINHVMIYNTEHSQAKMIATEQWLAVN